MPKKWLPVFVFILFQKNGYGQAKITDTVYYNNKWEICEKPMANFYRAGILAVLNDVWYFTGNVKDYTIDNKLIMTGEYSSEGKREGLFQFYNNSGKITLSASFEKGIASGNWSWYYPDGKERAIIFFPRDPQGFEFIKYNDEQGITKLENGTGEFVWHTNDYTSSFTNYIVSGACKSGKRVGDWNFSPTDIRYGSSGGYKEVFKDGRFIRRVNNDYSSGYVSKTPTSFFFSPPRLLAAESMLFDDIFRINGDSLLFSNVAYYLIEHKPTEVNLKYKIFDTAFNKVMSIINQYIRRRIYYNQAMDIDSKLEFKIGAHGSFENVTFTGQGIDSSAKAFFPYLLGKFRDMEMPGNEQIAMETNITLYIFLIDYREVLPGSMQNGFTKQLIISFEPREKMEKYLHENKRAIKDRFYDNLLNGNNYYYYYRRRN